MSYSSFTMDELVDKFQLKQSSQNLFVDVMPIEPSDWLKTTFLVSKHVPKRSEKARSEHYVVPILLELKQRNDNFFTYYSGETLNADKKMGLTGECDYILAKEKGTITISTPLFTLVEAEKQDFDLGTPQCIAQMLGAKVYNHKHHEDIDTIHGCVTTGTEWRFFKLVGDDHIISNVDTYFINDLAIILGIFQSIIDSYKN